MLILGLLLLLLAAAVITYMVLATAGMPLVALDYGILNLDMQPLWLYLAGAGTVAVAAIGLWLMAVGARAKARQAKEVRALRKQAKEQDRRIERSGDATAARADRTTTTPRTDQPRPTLPGPGGSRPAPGNAPGNTPGTTPGRSSLDLDR